MRFLILTQHYPPEVGAPPTRLAAMARELVHLGHEVEVVTAMPNYPTGRISQDYQRTFYCHEWRQGISVHRVWLYAAIGHGLKRLLNYLSFTTTSLFGLSQAKKPDFIFVQSPPLFLSIPAFIMSRFWRVPFIFNVSDLWPDSVQELGAIKSTFLIRIARSLEHWTYGKAKYVTAVTEGIREALTAKGVPASKLLFLPNGVDVDLFRPTAPDYAFQKKLNLDGKKILLYQGSLAHAHGLEVVLQAAKHMEKDRDIHFLFVGDGSRRAILEELSRELALKNITFMDPVAPEELPRFFSVAACGLVSLRNLPLFQGTRPSKIFPIMSSAKPVVYVGDGEGARLINEARAGIVLPFGRPEALADTLRKLVDSPDTAQALGQNGRLYVEEHFKWSTLIARWLEQLAAHSTYNVSTSQLGAVGQ